MIIYERLTGPCGEDGGCAVMPGCQCSFDEPTHSLTHSLTHVPNTVGRLVPACTCGWWSIDGSHWRFEQHLKKVTQP